MTIPRRYEDLTVDQFQKIEALKKLKDIELIDRAVLKLSILSGESVDYIESLHPDKIYDYQIQAIFLNSPIHVMPVNNEVKLGKKKFKPITETNGYTVAQHKDYKAFIQEAGGDYISCLPQILSICHKEWVEKDSIKRTTHIEPIEKEWRYMEKYHLENVELFKQAKLKDVIGAVFFYSSFLKSSIKIIQTCMEESQKEISDHLNTMMIDQEFQTFLKDGGMSSG